MLQCILVAVSHSFLFFGPKSNRGLIALISLHISRIVLPPGHALPSPFPPHSNCLACLSALLVPGTKRSRALLLPCLAQLVHVDDIIVCLTIYTNYPPNVWRLHHQCNNPQRRRKDEALNNLSPSAGFIDMRQVDTSIIIFIGSLTFRMVFSIRWWTQQHQPQHHLLPADYALPSHQVYRPPPVPATWLSHLPRFSGHRK